MVASGSTNHQAPPSLRKPRCCRFLLPAAHSALPWCRQGSASFLEDIALPLLGTTLPAASVNAIIV